MFKFLSKTQCFFLKGLKGFIKQGLSILTRPLPIPGPTVDIIRAAPGSAPAGRPSINHMRDHHLVDQDRLHQKSRHLFAHQGENTMKSSSYIYFVSISKVHWVF